MLRQLFLSRRGARTLTIPRRNVIAPGLWHPLTLRSISKPRFSGSQHALFSAPLPQLSTISGGLGCGIWARTFAARTGPGNEDGEHKSSPKNDSQPTGDDREANEEKKQAKEDGIDQPVDAADISSRLQKKAIPAEDATAYAAKLLGAKFTSPRKLAALTETKLDKLEFAMGDQAVALEAFQEWKEELTSAASGGENASSNPIFAPLAETNQPATLKECFNLLRCRMQQSALDNKEHILFTSERDDLLRQRVFALFEMVTDSHHAKHNSVCKLKLGAEGVGKSTLSRHLHMVAPTVFPNLLSVYTDVSNPNARLTPSALLWAAARRRGYDVVDVNAEKLEDVLTFLARHGLYGFLTVDELDHLYQLRADSDIGILILSQLYELVTSTQGRVFVEVTGSSSVLELLVTKKLPPSKFEEFPNYAAAPKLNGGKLAREFLGPITNRGDYRSLLEYELGHQVGDDTVNLFFWHTGGNPRATDRLYKQAQQTTSQLIPPRDVDPVGKTIFDQLCEINGLEVSRVTQEFSYTKCMKLDPFSLRGLSQLEAAGLATSTDLASLVNDKYLTRAVDGAYHAAVPIELVWHAVVRGGKITRGLQFLKERLPSSDALLRTSARTATLL